MATTSSIPAWSAGSSLLSWNSKYLLFYGGAQVELTLDNSFSTPQPSNDLWLFDTVSATWSLLSTNTTARAPPLSAWSMAAIAADVLHVNVWAGDTNNLPPLTLYRYDLKARQWLAPVTSLIPPIFKGSMFQYAGNLLMVGGEATLNTIPPSMGDNYTTAVIQYAPSTNTWTSLPPLPFSLNLPGATVTALGHAVTFGGYGCRAGPCPNASGAFQNKAYVSLLAQGGINGVNSQTWVDLNLGDAGAPTAREAPCVVAVDNVVYVYGGRSSSTVGKGFIYTYYDDLHALDLSQPTAKWKDLSSDAKSANPDFPSMQWA
ncbi:hypothetical protein HK104_002116 [Borealophlyctis nickersoniae]|nr:hypothetical protein HK104_002116 [Borealophlyctis nickersoniae]